MSGLLSADLPEPEKLKAEELPELLDQCDKAADLIERIRQRARAAIAAGRAVRGWRVQLINRRTVTDQKAAFARIWTDYGKEVAVRCIKLSLPLAAAALAKASETKRKTAQDRIERTLSGLIASTLSERLVRD
jgi:hypothetical protein